MKALFVDCSNGLAGDMLLAAFLDAGVPMKVFEDSILAMGLGKSFSFSIKEKTSRKSASSRRKLITRFKPPKTNGSITCDL